MFGSVAAANGWVAYDDVALSAVVGTKSTNTLISAEQHPTEEPELIIGGPDNDRVDDMVVVSDIPIAVIDEDPPDEPGWDEMPWHRRSTSAVEW